MNTKIDTVIFDLGGVLVDWDPKHVFKHIFKDKKNLEYFLNEVCNHDWNIKQDEGRTIKDAVTKKVEAFPEFEKEIHMYYEKWHLMFSGIYKENVALLHLLKEKKFNIYALTNWSAETWPKALELFPFFKEFDGVVVSGIEKTRKPYEPIYKLLIDRFQIIPENSVFIDDRDENVLTSKSLGFHGIHYKPGVNLKEKLISIGIEL